jgi:hypothetical protein
MECGKYIEEATALLKHRDESDIPSSNEEEEVYRPHWRNVLGKLIQEVPA